MKKVLLVDVDSQIPNIALMKLSTFYKSEGWEVDFKKLGLRGYPHKKKTIKINAESYERVHCSNIFRVNQKTFEVEGCDWVEIGGVGSINPFKRLPDHIDCLEQDYSLYPENKFSYGFITRGCIRECYFCFVHKTEGKIKYYASPRSIVKHKKVQFMDNNILAYKGHKEILKELKDWGIRCTFNQGLDLRLVDEENLKLLSQLNYEKEYIFAYDDIKYKNWVEEKTKLVKRYIPKDWKLKYYIYVHPDMPLKDTLERIEWCRENKILPYLMRDEACWGTKYAKFYMSLASYCNQPMAFKSITFTQFLPQKIKDQERIKREIELYNHNK